MNFRETVASSSQVGFVQFLAMEDDAMCRPDVLCYATIVGVCEKYREVDLEINNIHLSGTQPRLQSFILKGRNTVDEK